jgi:four helix bundle protein
VAHARFSGLDAYRAAEEIAAYVNARARRWSQFDRSSIGLQLVRAAGSIGANIAEATGRYQPRDQRQFFLIARGSLMETAHWVRQAQRLNLLNDELNPLLDEAGRTLNGLIRRANANANAKDQNR